MVYPRNIAIKEGSLVLTVVVRLSTVTGPSEPGLVVLPPEPTPAQADQTWAQ